ncbi:hypothetical protein GGP80_003180 [Salinibacter ruber]|jgi:hypothetical protein|uniref:hypothetical protein n=1 Tax=Salinibacter ruber TaxID=146919 RepID=UPI0020734DB7|nr:hypothetical protein [Salinibacter ruber]MCS3937171.1 hypothetical protein [Salinibacter ruber]MCS4099946.1 hypothetical protein [Salinibacter ruber]MCS4119569.1 hypothetical protein [Salinibacter ruber]
MSKPDLPGAGDKPTDRNLSDLLPDDSGSLPDGWDDIGSYAERHDREERPRREQMNLDIDDGIKRRFKEHIEDGQLQMRFVVEDLLRIYLSQK